MAKCGVSVMCVVCTVVSVVSVAILVGIWTFQLLKLSETPTVVWESYRLPGNLLPDVYSITLWPRLQPDHRGLYVFTGNSSVVFRCVKETDLIVIHCNKLNLTTPGGHPATLTSLGGSPAPDIKSTRMQVNTQYLMIQLNGRLKAGESYELFTEFEGELADDLEGFYRSEYIEDGVKKVVATSQMHPTHARKTFPCFDEPAMKAVFHITVLHQRGTVALSNEMEIEHVNTTVSGTEVTITKFRPTPRMSSYLLALVVSDYTNVQSNQSTLIRIWARRKAVADGHCDYALNLTGPVLKFFEDYYQVPYPLSKSDQIALPDFYFGAMENWGLVTYRETKLLFDPLISSNGNKEKTATIIAHELAHMWFGNLVTLKWWNEVWLNEGFATYVSYLGADYAEPTWNLRDLSVLEDHRVFAVDALASSRPLSSKEEEILRPEQISEVFDAISYSKGASVLRMLSDFLTESVFLEGLKTYLNTFAYNNTVGSDLWNHLQAAADANGTVLPVAIRDIMDRWVLQMGFPVVTVNTRTGRLSQKHFLLDPESVVDTPSQFNYEWMVPIRWMKSGVEQVLVWLMEESMFHSGMKMAGDDWVLLNLKGAGYYRVNYDSENWENIIKQLNIHHQIVPIINRALILDDTFNLARAKMIPISLALNTTRFLWKERDYVPWKAALDNLDYFYLMFDQTALYNSIQMYLRKQVTPLFEHYQNITMNWTKVPDGHMDQYNQVNAIRVACNTGVPSCQNLTTAWFTEWIQNPEQNPIHPNLRSTVYCSAVAAGGAKEWDFAWEMLQTASIASEADKLMSALACTKDKGLLSRYIRYTLDPTKIRKQDATSVIVQIAGNREGRDLAWNFVTVEWKYLFTEYGVGSFSFSELISGVTQTFSTQQQLDQLLRFKEENAAVGFGSASSALDQSIEKTKANMKWVSENQREITDWFRAETA
ncbi:aminopeptidase N-like [Hoplias malabaricus]|uniref:aminopeptidase N-like n=1 Tax=Hoplias malabaricus TaxID=27720 RepID=UPI003462F539